MLLALMGPMALMARTELLEPQVLRVHKVHRVHKEDKDQ